MSMMSRSNVVFPAPLGPRRPKISPLLISKEISCTATTVRKAFLTEYSAMAGEDGDIGNRLTTTGPECSRGYQELLAPADLASEKDGWLQYQRHQLPGRSDSSRD